MSCLPENYGGFHDGSEAASLGPLEKEESKNCSHTGPTV